MYRDMNILEGSKLGVNICTWASALLFPSAVLHQSPVETPSNLVTPCLFLPCPLIDNDT